MNDSLRQCVFTTPFFDTHSHMMGMDFGGPVDDREGLSLTQVICHDYLAYMGGSVAGPTKLFNAGAFGPDQGREHYLAIEEVLDQFRAQGTYAGLREGIRLLHPFEGADITGDNFDAINASVLAAYRQHGRRAWQRLACQKMGVPKQTHMCMLPYITEHWPSLPEQERALQQQIVVPALIIDSLAFTGMPQNKIAREKSYDIVGLHPSNYQEHLDFCGRVLDRFVAAGGRVIKLLSAYSRPLAFSEVPDDVAAGLFARGLDKLSPDELRLLQDNLFWKVLELGHARGLNLIVHAGYSWPAQWAHPQHLLAIFRCARLAGMKVDICHSGWPNEGEAMIFARTFGGAYFNLCWTPLLSPTLGRRILHEAIDMVPISKVLLGTDCATAEMFAGAVQLVRQQLYEVLLEKIAAGQFGLEVAQRLARAFLYENALDFYGMTESDLSAPAGGHASLAVR